MSFDLEVADSVYSTMIPNAVIALAEIDMISRTPTQPAAFFFLSSIQSMLSSGMSSYVSVSQS